MNKEKLIQFVEKNFDEHAIRKSFNIDYIRLSNFLIFLEQNSSIKKILEIGPGFGFVAAYLADNGYDVTVVEHPAAYLNTDINSLKELSKKFNFNVVLADIEIEPVNTQCDYDLAYSLAVIEHLHHTPKSLLKIKFDACKNGGFVYADTPNAVNLRKRLSLFMGIYPYVPIEYLYENEFNRSHIREYSARDLFYIFDQYGFKDVKVKITNTMNKSKRLSNLDYERYDGMSDNFSLYGLYSLITQINDNFKDTLVLTAKVIK